jgi:hypothetical protein
MRFRTLWPFGLFALALASSGCNGGRKNPPDTLVRVLNATANYPALTLKRGPVIEPVPLRVDFLGGQQTTWDEDTYNFHVTYANIQTNAEVEVEHFTKQVVNGTWYTFVLYQKAGNVTHAVLESPPPSSTATDAQVQAIHVVEGVPTVDLYLVAPGADITGMTPWGTLSFEGTLPQRSVAAGDYEIVATEAGNQARVLYTSPSFTLSAGASLTFALTPDSGEGIQPFSITVLNDTSAVLIDPSLPGGLRVINGASDHQPRDVAVNNEFTPPLFPNTVYATATGYLPVPPIVDLPVNVTPAGNPGVLELTAAYTPTSGSFNTLLVTGATGALIPTFPQEDRRRVKSQAKIVFYDVAASCELCDILMLTPGTDPNTVPAYDSLTGLDPHPTVSPGSVFPATQWPADFEVTVRVQGTQTIVSGPTLVTLKDSGLYGIVLADNPNGTTIDMILIDDFQH